MINTVLGKIDNSIIDKCLCHEHICCFSEYVSKMIGEDYFDEKNVVKQAVKELKTLKNNHSLNLFIDCTPVNIGRNIPLLKKISTESGVHIVCSTGFYYTQEPILYGASEEIIAEYIVKDAKSVNAGVIKAAVETEEIDFFNEKLLKATALAHNDLKLPIALHTNAKNKNALKAIEILVKYNVEPNYITIGHLSDTEDFDYVLEIARLGCFIGLDRLYDNKSKEYIEKKIKTILDLCNRGFENKILLSHDESVFNGFDYIPIPLIKEKTRFSYVFEYILPKLDKTLVDLIMRKNPLNMLTCKRG